MPQNYAQTTKVEFNKGLLTEFSELAFPDNASIDELNCELFKAGNRAKRKGIKLEDNYVESTNAFPRDSLYHTCTWENVANDAKLVFLVIQVGATLQFVKKGVFPFSSGEVKNTSNVPVQVDLTPYEHSGSMGAGYSKINVASVNGYLVVVSPQINSIYISWDKDLNDIEKIEEIDFRIRDYTYYSDRLELMSKVSPASSVSIQRKYDTANVGWMDETQVSQGGSGPVFGGLFPPEYSDILNLYVHPKDAYPPLTHPWYSGKDSSGDFKVAEWEKVASGSSLIANGGLIVKIFSNKREFDGTPFTTYSDGTPIAFPKGRFSATSGYAGRAWFAGVDSRVYYSQMLESIYQVGNCYSSNDPTAEYSSDVLDTDGGYIQIVEANGIKALHVFGSSLLVFAENGVWRISGGDGNLFRASDFSVYKISDNGLSARTSLVAGQNAVPFWWSYTGIHTVQVTEEGGMVEVNLSKDTIQTHWNEITGPTRAAVTGEYDAVNNTVLWMYPLVGEDDYKFNNLLFLNVDLGAFFPWKVTDYGVNTPVICGASFFKGSGSTLSEFTVVDSNGDDVVDSNGDTVIVHIDAGTIRSSDIFFMTRLPNGHLTFSLFDGISYLDWEEEDYEAYAESAYNFMGDLSRSKNSPYLTVFLRETETGFVEQAGQYFPIEESSLKVSAYWDFKKKGSCSPQQAYRHKMPMTFEELESFPSPTTVLSTRLKVRGRGKMVRLRFEGEKGKAFNLLGWETIDAVNPGL